MFPAFSGKQLYKMLERGSHAALGLNNCTAPGQCASPRACRTARRPCSLRKIAHNLRAAPAGHTQRRPQVSGSGSDSGAATCQKPSAGRQNHQNPGAEANTEMKERGFSFTLRTDKRQWQRQRRRHMPKTMRRATREQMLRRASTVATCRKPCAGLRANKCYVGPLLSPHAENHAQGYARTNATWGLYSPPRRAEVQRVATELPARRRGPRDAVRAVPSAPPRVCSRTTREQLRNAGHKC
jgi:hypothetical protein